MLPHWSNRVPLKGLSNRQGKGHQQPFGEYERGGETIERQNRRQT